MLHYEAFDFTGMDFVFLEDTTSKEKKETSRIQ